MKTTRLFLLVLCFAASICNAVVPTEPISEPGWYETHYWEHEVWLPDEAAAQAPDSGVSPSGAEDPSGAQPVVPIAEAATTRIQALAAGLGNDPLRIFNYVHDRIRHVLYFGSKKGAELTLLERSGNDFDQSALLVSLLRAAGYTNAGYQFGWMLIPYDNSDGSHRDLRHWLELSLVNTNWSYTSNYLRNLFVFIRGYPTYATYQVWGTNIWAFQRVWVKLPIGSTNYYLDPAFKVSEPVTNVFSLTNAMGFGSNALWSAAGGTVTGDYVQSLNESGLRDKLREYTTNFLNYLQSNQPNASVEEVMGGQRIMHSAGTALPQSLLFPTYEWAGTMPILNWTNQPTNMMSTMAIRFANTNNPWYRWLIPQLQGQRLTLSFATNGLAELRQDDTLLATNATAGGSRTNVVLSVHHPNGTWDYTHNLFVDGTFTDQIATNSFQRTNATYNLLYAFEPDWDWLQARQRQLDKYRQQGLADTSREVVGETLNIMGLNWQLQAEFTGRILGTQMDITRQYYHRMGRMAQESGQGYYVDAYMVLAGSFSKSGADSANDDRIDRYADLGSYFASALEHGSIEQLQSSNLLGASTIKMLQIASTNGQKIFLANSANWTTGTNVRGQLANYASLSKLDAYISANYSVLVPQNGSNLVAGAGSWAGYGYVARGEATAMSIGGGYFGGYVSVSTATVNPSLVGVFAYSQPDFINPSSPLVKAAYAADPVNMADGSFRLAATDLNLGGAEPRGINFTRHYSPNRRNHNLVGMAYGWTHNYQLKATEIAAPQAGLGITTPAQMAPMLAATAAAIGIYNDLQPNPKNWLVCALIAKWGIDQLAKNGVSIALGEDTIQFVQQPDGAFTPPAGNTMSLLKTNSAYQLQERHGNTFKFDSAGLATNIVSQYTNASLTISYTNNDWVSSVRDWKNRTLTFNYTGTPQRLTSVSDGDGHSAGYGYSTTYNSAGDLASVTDAENKTNAFIYDTNHQMIATLNALGQTVTSNRYDDLGRVLEQYSQGLTNQTWQFFWSDYESIERDPLGGQRTFLYDDKHRLTGTRDALGNLSQTLYDGQDHVTMTVSPLNETNRFEYDGRHNLLRTVDPLGYTNRLYYDGQDRLTASVDARGNTNRFGYNAQHSLTGSTNGAGDWASSDFNSDGTLHTRTDPGGTTTYGYDSTYGQLNSITYPGSLGSEGFLNNARGDLLSHTNARGFVTSFQYNQRRELTNTIAPTNVSASVSYDGVGNVQSSKDARGFTTSNTWSATRKLLATTLPATPQGAPMVTNSYDNRDWLTRTLNPLQKATWFTNDAAGRLIATIDPLQRATTIGYDADERRTATTNAALEITRQEWTARSELRKLTDGASHTVFRSYDGAGNQITLTNRNTNRWQFQFDGANRLTNTITPLGRETRITFDARGLVSTVREPSMQTATNYYDAKGRLTNLVDGVASKTFRYDANNNVTNIVEAGKTNAWTFDAYDHVSSYRDADGNLIQYGYDASGNLTNLIYPGNRAVAYAYDSLNRLTNVTDWANRKTSFEYDLASRLTKVTRPNGTVREVRYDAAGQTTNIVERLTNNAPIAFFKLNWNDAARVAWEFAGPLPHSNSPPTRAMTFDDDNRLKTFNGSNVTNDADGNLIWGPLTNNTLTGYSYDVRNRLLNVGGAAYGYDPAGNRSSVSNASGVAAFVVNPNAALSQVLMRVKGGVTNYYIYGLGLLYEITETATNTSTLTYHYDYRGSTVALTDSNGIPTPDRIEYSPYGSIAYRAGTNDTPFLFNGRYGVQTDPDGLLYMRARYYNPYLCRFLNADPSGFSGGLNFYAYADGNPISYLDPFGLSAWDQFMGGVRAIGGGLETAAGYGLATAGAGISTTGVGALIGVPAAALGVAIGAHGLDQVQAGTRQAISGNHVDSFTSGDLQMLGMSQNAANLTDAGISVVGSFGAGAATVGIRATQIAAESGGLAQGMSTWQMLNTYDQGATALNTADFWALGGNFTSPLYKGLLMQQGVNLSGDAYQLSTTALGGFGQSLRLATTGLTPLGYGLIAGPGGAIGGAANGVSWLGTPIQTSPSGK